MINPAELRQEVERLAQSSAWPGCPGGGWQFPFDLGNGVVTRTYVPLQSKLHPWRRDILLNNLDAILGRKYEGLSVLDLGCCEGAMAAGLWERGARDVTLVEGRNVNIEKAKFVARVKGYNFRIVEADVDDFLRSESKTYDIVLFMEILQLLLDPFRICRLIAQHTRGLAVYDTALALPSEIAMRNSPQYGVPSSAGFFLRNMSSDANTAGLGSLELWPTREALQLVLKEAGFSRTQDAAYGDDPYNWYSSGERAMLFAHK